MTKPFPKESFNIAYKQFANRHGLKTTEIGTQESRTMDYKTDFPHKKKRIKQARKLYGNPRKWVRWAKKENETQHTSWD